MIYNRPEYWLGGNKMPKPDGEAYLTFISPEVFSIAIGNANKNWDGTLEYFTVDGTWAEWDGSSSIQAKNGDDGYVLYFRGTGNTVITGYASDTGWSITGTNVRCSGNIETLLDYEMVGSGNHPTMGTGCYYGMFEGCTSLTEAPSLPATTLAEKCYCSMLKGCTSLTEAPSLPATTLATQCYYGMFEGCTTLSSILSLPATKLAENCYGRMFYGCKGLTKAPSLPATTLAKSCYTYMFDGCTSLTKAPSLPATTLYDFCYRAMFSGCTTLSSIPSLPATKLKSNCYRDMFWGCKKIKLSETEEGEYTQSYRIPKSGTGTTATNALASMFSNTGGTFTEYPSINTTYYLSSSNEIV